MSTEDNKAIAHRIIKEFSNEKRLGLLDDLFAEDFVNHSPGPGYGSDREGLKQFMSLFHAAFPDMLTTIDDLVAGQDKVAIRMTGRGTHTGDLMGIPPTGKHVTVTSISIISIVDGKVAERWNITDILSLLQQLGVSPSMG